METKDFVRYWDKGAFVYSPGLMGNEQDARVYFWNNSQEDLLKYLREEINNGWKPITEVGPASIKVRTFDKLTFGQMITGVPARTWYEAEEFRVVLMKEN
jgi:hypothetical protein